MFPARRRAIQKFNEKTIPTEEANVFMKFSWYLLFFSFAIVAPVIAADESDVWGRQSDEETEQAADTKTVEAEEAPAAGTSAEAEEDNVD